MDKMYKILNDIDQRLKIIESEVREVIEEKGLEVRPEYIKKLEKIEKGSFLSREEFEKELASS